MPWQATKALEIGKDIEIHVTSPEHPGENHTYHFGFPSFAAQTKAQFKAMVKREVALYVRDLNAVEPIDDITDEILGGTSSSVSPSKSNRVRSKAVRNEQKSS